MSETLDLLIAVRQGNKEARRMLLEQNTGQIGRAHV